MKKNIIKELGTELGLFNTKYKMMPERGGFIELGKIERRIYDRALEGLESRILQKFS